MNRNRIKAAHVRQIAAAQRAIAQAAGKLVREQLASAARELEAGGIAQAAAIFKPREWDDPLKAALGPAIGRIMLRGAAQELVLARRRKPAKAVKVSTATEFLERYGIDLGGEITTEMPPEMIDRIGTVLADSFDREYWQGVNDTTRDDLETLLNRSLTDGLSTRETAQEIEAIAPGYSRERATAIARTESGRALNAGHVEGIRELERDSGERIGKTWLSVLGTTTRPEHADLDGVTVGTDEPFILAGIPCMYPGDASLPPEHAINCLCTVLSGMAELD